jgi:hypothetical protein
LSKNSRGQKEYSRMQEVLHENKKLKREIASLRKQLARIDLDRHGYVKDILEEHYEGEQSEKDTDKVLQSLKDQWKCHECPEGFLEIMLYTKVGETWYFRKCNKCTNRTKSQQYSSDTVQGIMKQSKITP